MLLDECGHSLTIRNRSIANLYIHHSQPRVNEFLIDSLILGHHVLYRGKFPKKLCCCVGGEYYKVIWLYYLG